MTTTTQAYNNILLPEPSASAMLAQKYQLFYYKKREVFRVLAKNKFDDPQQTAGAALKLIDQIDQALKGMLVFSTVNYISGITLEENTAITVWNTENYATELLISGNKKIKMPSGYGDNPRFNLSWFRGWSNNQLMTAFDAMYLVPFGDNMHSFFNGKKFCVTGRTDIRRETIKFIVTALGGSYLTQISGNTDYLIVLDEEEARKPSTKLRKAKELYKDLEIITEKSFVKMLPDLRERDLHI